MGTFIDSANLPEAFAEHLPRCSGKGAAAYA